LRFIEAFKTQLHTAMARSPGRYVRRPALRYDGAPNGQGQRERTARKGNIGTSAELTVGLVLTNESGADLHKERD
jgi:hypothetical protein